MRRMSGRGAGPASDGPLPRSAARVRRLRRGLLRALIALGAPLLIAACASGVISADSTGITIEHSEGGPDPKKIAAEHCAKLDLKPQLIAVEPMTFVTQIYYFSCV